MKIGIFDSGLGGITILNQILSDLKNKDIEYVYLADNKNAPYGTKTHDQILEYTETNVKTLKNKGCKIIVLACNTATSVAIQYLRNKYKDIIFIGTEPPIKVAVDNNVNNKKIFVFATTLTLQEKKLNNLIEKLNVKDLVTKVALDELVIFAETDEIQTEKVELYLKDRIKEYDITEYGYIVLGCTHFPLFRDIFKNIFKTQEIISPSLGVSKYLRNLIETNFKIESNRSKNKIQLVLTSENLNENCKFKIKFGNLCIK